MTVGKPNFNLNSFGIKYLSKDEVQELLNKAPPMDMRSSFERHRDNEKEQESGVSNIKNEVNLTELHGDKPEKITPRSSVRAHQRLHSNAKPTENDNPNYKKPQVDYPFTQGTPDGLGDTKDSKFVHSKQAKINEDSGFTPSRPKGKPNPPHDTPTYSGNKTVEADEPPKSSLGHGNRRVTVSRTGNVSGKDRKPVTEAGKEKPTRSKDGKKELKTLVGATAGTMINNPKDPKGHKISSARLDFERREGRADLETEEKPLSRASNSGTMGVKRKKLSESKGGQKVIDTHAKNALNNRHTEEGKKHIRLHDEAAKKYPSNGKDNSHLDEHYKHVTGKYYHETTNTESDATKKKKKESLDNRKTDDIETEKIRRGKVRMAGERKEGREAGGVDAVENTKPKSGERSDKYDRDEDPDQEGYGHKDDDFKDNDSSTDESTTDNSASGFESEASFNKRRDRLQREREEKARKENKESRKKTPQDEKDEKKISQYDRAGTPKGGKGLKGDKNQSLRPDKTQEVKSPLADKPNTYPKAAERARQEEAKESKKSNDIIMDMNIMKLDLMKDATDGKGSNKPDTREDVEGLDWSWGNHKRDGEIATGLNPQEFQGQSTQARRSYNKPAHLRGDKFHSPKPFSQEKVYDRENRGGTIKQQAQYQRSRTKDPRDTSDDDSMRDSHGARNVTEAQRKENESNELAHWRKHGKAPPQKKPSKPLSGNAPSDLGKSAAETVFKAISLKLDLTTLK